MVVGWAIVQAPNAARRVFFDTRTNQIFVTDVPSKLEEIQALIAKIDTPVRQVMIEARIVEANDTFGKSLGVKLGGSDLRGVRGGVPGWGGNDRIGVGGNYDAIGYQTGQIRLVDGLQRLAVRGLGCWSI